MAFTLQLLHLADGEAGLLAGAPSALASFGTAANLAALVDAFDGDYANTLILAGGDNFIPGPFLSAGTDISVRDELNAVTGSTISLATSTNHPIAAIDIAIHNEIGVEVSAIGNHEFDLGSRVFRDSFTPGSVTGWVGANFVHVSANLDFSGDSDLSSRFTNTVDGGTTTLIPEASTLKGRIAPAAVVTKGGEKIGIVGATTQILEAISSPSGTEVKGFPTGAGANGEADNMALLASQLQPIINELIAEGVDKVILQAHLQIIGNEQALAQLLTGVDIILSAGSNTRLGDADDVAVNFPGHAANFANTYPIVTAGLDGKPTLIVNTDNEYTYLGRLVVNFDDNGEIIVGDLAGLSSINGAYASTDANVEAAWAGDGGFAAAFAEGTKGEEVADLTGAVQSVITAQDGNVAGFTSVYLQGERIAVRNQETNLGNLTADANAGVLKTALGSVADTTFVVSLKNGGGIRAQIGTVSAPDPVDGTVDFLPPAANPDAGKAAGGISQLDIANSLRFNNGLIAFDTTAAGLKAILEHGVAVLGNNGRFPQIGGVRFSYDPDLPANSRIQSIALIDETDTIIAELVKDGQILAGVPASITVVTLNFLANGGDSYPIKANGENFRFLLNDGTLSAPVSESLNFTVLDNGSNGGVPAAIFNNILGEQQALFDYLQDNFANSGTAFSEAETPDTQDLRIQNLNVRNDAVFQGQTIDGGATDDTLVGTLGNDTINGGAGNDSVSNSAGNDTIDGGEGVDTLTYANGTLGVSINLASGEAAIVTQPANGVLTTAASMLQGENGFSVLPLLTVGETLANTTGALNSTSAGNYSPVGIFDGIGATSLDANTVRVFVNSELANTLGATYKLENGVELKGARISYFDIDKTTKAIKDGGIAYGEVYDSLGNEVTGLSQFVNNAQGFDRFCSGALFEANTFGAGRGITEAIYFAGEETGGNFSTTSGNMWALDVDTGELWSVPGMGRGAWENVTQLDTGNTTHVAFIVSDDTSPFNAGGDAANENAPLFLYVGEKNAAGNFLQKNGLDGGKLYVWVSSDPAKTSPLNFNANGSTQSGTWVEIDNSRNAALASENGSTGYDEFGYPTQRTLWLRAETAGAFGFSRPEDVSTNPANGAEFVLASTGGVSALGDPNGTVYTMAVDFTNIAAPTGTLKVLYDGNDDATNALRTPDNLDWSADGFIYVQEDRSNAALFSATAPNSNEASIVRINATTGLIERVAEIDRTAVPFGQSDTSPTDFGNWESSGILDVSTLFGETAGSLFIADVQAHSLRGGTITTNVLVEGGQLSLIAKPGVSISSNVELDTVTNVENVVGSAFADTIIGNSVANDINGGAGNDRIDGGAGNDNINGGAGDDEMIGGAGNDTFAVLNSGDTVVEAAGGGSDTLYSRVDFTLGTGQHVEVLKVIGDGGAGRTLTGNELDNNLAGRTGNDTLIGGAGNDLFNGLAGTDTVFGGTGNDIIFVDNAGDIVIEAVGEGRDAVYATTSYTLAAGQEIETLLSWFTEGVTLVGNEFNNAINGHTGAEILDGGLGNDRLTGRGGDDTFRFDDNWGADRIADFQDDVDTLDFTLVDGLDAYAQLSITQVGANVLIGFSGQTVLVENALVANLTNDVIV